MAERNEHLTPFMAVHVGSVIKEELKERGIKQAKFAKILNVQPSHLSELLQGKRSLSADMALKIQGALGMSAQSLLRMQANYDYDSALIRQRDIEELSALNELTEYSKVIDWKYILRKLNVELFTSKGILDYLKRTFGQYFVAELQIANGHFRKNDNTMDDDERKNIMTWVLLARYSTKSIMAKGAFDRTKLHECGQKLREVFNANDNTFNRTAAILSEYGIKLSRCEKLPKTRIDGYSCYVDGIPCIIVTNRYNRIDNFAFNILHELGHLERGEEHDAHINIEDYSKDDPEEKYADGFANDILLPYSIWNQAPEVRMSARAIQKSYSDWAKSIGVNKWIVLGRVGYETGIHNFSDPYKTRRIQ